MSHAASAAVPSRDFVRARVLVLAGGLASFAAARAYAPYVHDGPVLCVLRGLTGLPCPGCGLTRAACALSRGDVVAALEWNALSIPIALTIVAASAIATAELARGSAWQFHRRLDSWLMIRVGVIATLVYHLGRCVYWGATGQLLQ